MYWQHYIVNVEVCVGPGLNAAHNKFEVQVMEFVKVPTHIARHVMLCD